MSRHPPIPSSTLQLPPVDAEVALRHELVDITSRARLGGIFYVAGLITVSIASDTPTRYPLVFAIAAVLFVVLGVLRLRRPPADMDANGARRWIRQLWLIIWASTGLWGLGAAWVVATTDIENARVLALVLNGAFGTTLSHVYAMRLWHGVAGLALLFVPQLVVLLPQAGSQTLGISLLIYFIYLLLVLRRSRSEYWRRVALEEETRNQRDFYEQQSQRDGLTSLPNRRRFDVMLASALGRRSSLADTDAVSLILFDLDHFKAINDRFGHAAGDHCLVHFSGCLGELFNGNKALPARLGGEEFAVILLGCELPEAARRAEVARQALVDCDISHEGVRVPLTVSGGVVSAISGETAASLLARADTALYDAKRDGRDRIVARHSALPGANTLATQ